MNELYEKLFHEIYLLTGQGELDKFKSYLAEDASWTEAAGFPYSGTYVGLNEIVKYVYERLGSEWNNYAAKDLAYGFNGNQVFVCGKYSGEFTATGKSFIADFVHVYKFNANNKVQKFIQVVDIHTFF